MKKQTLFIGLLASSLCFSSCATSDTMTRTYVNTIMGSWFGSAIGGIIGGRAGADLGSVIGAGVGAATSIAAEQKEQRERQTAYEQGFYDARRNEELHYERYTPMPAAPNTFQQLEVSNLTFADESGDRVLRAGEKATITFEIYNRGQQTVYNIAPIVTADYNRILVSPTALIDNIPPGRGMRYRAQVSVKNNARYRNVNFSIAFANAKGEANAPVKTFSIRVEE